MASIAQPGALVYVEVPFESATEAKMVIRRALQFCVCLLLRPRVAMSLLKPGMLCLMHEHINYFNLRSLSALMEKRGWKVVAAETETRDSPMGKASVAWCLAKR